ncbi:glutaminyl-tRNA synthetase [Puia dinghuensis]|uniref:Glutaminyl-tRNA synthetase n=2 Tax=Puia dinghuensis TaxID=1792502 RepID=A0A8J2UD54_9BACT|nr:glutaminyl-tRNA synthetase [Puia dinghuensis]
MTALAATAYSPVLAQRRHPVLPAAADTSKPKPPAFPGFTLPKQGPKPYKEVITDKAVTHYGLFTVHKIDERWYFEIPDSLLGREFMAITRFSKTAAGGGIYGGELANQQTLEWDKGPAHTLFLRVVTLVSMADSTSKIYKAVKNSSVDPIASAFDIKAYGKDSASVVIDVTDYFKGDNLIVSIPQGIKGRMRLGGLASDRSYIEHINTYPINTEVRSVKTFSTGGGMSAAFGLSFSSPTDAAGAVTLELNTSFILLPAAPMSKRLFDSRVGYFADDYVVYSDEQQKIENQQFIVRWRLEPRPEDREKWLHGELVRPAKPIIYYIDPATPRKWVPYLIQGVNDWQRAFEQAGFKDAIEAREWPDGDSTMSLEDARYSVLRYFASDIENAYGPNVHDPRSGEIIESHIGWYHNIMEILHDWYMIQAGAVDPRARSMHLDDSLMGQLIRFVSSHEVGHTLGLRHNMGSSSTVPVEKLRDKGWLDIHGHTPSIMDYARFNYVAQPQDDIPEIDLFPRIGEYDRWAIRWGYAYAGGKDPKEESKILNKWVIDSLRTNPRLWFGGEGFNQDPRAQTEDLGDNSIKASEYGIQNLRRILPGLPAWTKEEADKYQNLAEMYRQVVAQFNRYMGHVLKNVGGVYETFRSVEQPGDVYEPTPAVRQREAVRFLNNQLFETPRWLLDNNILNKISSPSGGDPISPIQTAVLSSLLSANRLNNLLLETNRYGATHVYTVEELLDDVRKGIWGELSKHQPTDAWRRDLQKTYVESLISVLNSSGGSSSSLSGLVIYFGPGTKNTDLPSIARAELTTMRTRILAAIPMTTDKLTRYHLEDLAQRIRRALDPK